MNKIFKLFGVCFLICFFSFTSIDGKKVIVIDAGHGGNDSGANINEIKEKDIVLSIANKIKELNTNKNIEIILTRDSDTYKSLSYRTDFIKKLNPDLVISLHINNSSNTQKKGQEIYTKTENGDLAKKLALKFGDCKISSPNLHLLKNSTTPTIYLELGFMSNIEDRYFLSSSTGLEENSTKIIAFINEL